MSTLETYDSHRRDQFQVRILEVLLLRRESQGFHASPTPVPPPPPRSQTASFSWFYLVAGGGSCSLAGRDGLWPKYPTMTT